MRQIIARTMVELPQHVNLRRLGIVIIAYLREVHSPIIHISLCLLLLLNSLSCRNGRGRQRKGLHPLRAGPRRLHKRGRGVGLAGHR
jgi:hypothetical protein